MSYKADRIPPIQQWTPDRVRQNYGMYVGGKDLRAFNHVLFFLIEDMLSSVVRPSTIAVTLTERRSVVIEDDGLPGYAQEPFDEAAFEWIHTRFHRVWENMWLVVANALSSELISDVYTGTHHYRQIFRRGEPLGPAQRIGETRLVGRRIEYLLDDEMDFQKPAQILPTMIVRSRHTAALTPGLTIALADALLQQRMVFCYPDGLATFLPEELALRDMAAEGQLFHLLGQGDGVQVEVAWGLLSENRVSGLLTTEPFLISFVNRDRSPEGGTHVKGFWSGLKHVLRETYADLLSSTPLRSRDLHPHIVAAIAVKLAKPQWVGPVRQLIENPEAASAVEHVLTDQLPLMLRRSDPKRFDHLIYKLTGNVRRSR